MVVGPDVQEMTEKVRRASPECPTLLIQKITNTTQHILVYFSYTVSKEPT